MKNFCFSLSVICSLIIGAGCSKSSVSRNSSLIGTWELRHAWGGWGYDSVFIANNGNSFSFTKDSVKVYANGNLSKDIYSIKTDNNVEKIYIGVNPAYGTSFKISNDTLYLDLEATAFDGVASAYVKTAQ